MSQRVEISGVSTSALPKMDAKRSRELLERIKQGDEAAREEFITGNIRLVLSVAGRFSTRRASGDDVFQAGCVGLIKAIDNFDLSVGVRFSTYAVPMIIGEIKRFLRGGNSLRVARSIRDAAYRILKAREAIEAEDREATTDEIARRLNITERDVVYALDAISDHVSLFDPAFNKEGDTLLVMDQIGDDRNTEENWTEHVALASAMETLGERERNILYLRYYEGKTQTEISKSVGLSQAQVSRLEKTALASVRHGLS